MKTTNELLQKLLTALGVDAETEVESPDDEPEPEPWVPAPQRPEYMAYMKRVTKERESGTLPVILRNK